MAFVFLFLYESTMSLSMARSLLNSRKYFILVYVTQFSRENNRKLVKVENVGRMNQGDVYLAGDGFLVVRGIVS